MTSHKLASALKVSKRRPRFPKLPATSMSFEVFLDVLPHAITLYRLKVESYRAIGILLLIGWASLPVFFSNFR